MSEEVNEEGAISSKGPAAGVDLCEEPGLVAEGDRGLMLISLGHSERSVSPPRTRRTVALHSCHSVLHDQLLHPSGSSEPRGSVDESEASRKASPLLLINRSEMVWCPTSELLLH